MAEPVDIEHLPQTPVLQLDLGANGGTLAPYSLEELRDWLADEINFWSWLSGVPQGPQQSTIGDPVGRLREAQGEVQSIISNPNRGDRDTVLQSVRQRISSALITSRLPHSQTALAAQVESLRVKDAHFAAGYLYAQMPNTNNNRFEWTSHEAWRGYVLGLLRNAPEEFAQGITAAAQSAFDALVGDARSKLSKEQREFEVFRADLAGLVDAGKSQVAKQNTDFSELSAKAEKGHSDALAKHEDELGALRKTFKEEMSLRSPVEYWQSREDYHTGRRTTMLKATFGSLALTGLSLVLLMFWATQTSSNPASPDIWRLAFVAFVAAIGVWITRLFVRMFLSDAHLATDAAERVTMVKTYLALLEGAKLPADDDRKLILQALFRHSTDGMVKDEGLPHPALELLTRTPK